MDDVIDCSDGRHELMVLKQLLVDELEWNLTLWISFAILLVLRKYTFVD